MKHRLGIVFALGVGLFGQASALAQPAPAAGADQADPSAPPPSPNPDAPPPPPPPGDPAGAPDAPPPVTLPPYLTGNTTTPLNPPPPPGQEPMLTVQPPGPGADAGVTPKKAPPRVRWRGTNLNWNNSVTTTALGLGRDNIGGENEEFVTGLGLTLNYYLLEPKLADGTSRGYSLRVAAGFGFDTELTNGSTKKLHETQLRDTSVAFVLSKPIWESADKEWSFATNFNATFTLPTSKNSYGSGIYLGVSPRATAFLNIPIRGKDASFLDSILLGVGVRYDHRFTRADVPTNPDIAAKNLEQNLAGFSRPNDVLGGRFLDTNSVRPSAFIFFDENIFGRQLQVFVAGGLNYRILNEAGGGGTGVDCTDQAVITTGPACVMHQDVEAPNYALSTAFSVGLTYFPMVEWGISLGYDNVASNLSPKSQIQDPFYSASAQFSAGILLSLDAIYERLTGPERDEPFIVFGSNKKTPKVPALTPSQRELFF
ncbi:hypothetical protein [Polyangium sp. 6x1]|uniref:hypothetical protein n=1 Tax=Polyangium sp. 6x1 TaxID=3042689 RepID=UPI002482E4B7|nr:hypothetical protein [Polyangium sp. 6x1]MDI1445044.1 hypothetical protein [Polyangium sp. 6x1]